MSSHALGAARQLAYERLGHDAARDGVAGLPRGRIYGSAEMHHCALKAAGLLGLGRSSVTLVPVDGRDRVDVAALRREVQRDIAEGVVPIAVMAVAGTTNTGALDDVAALADVAAEHGTWLHVDGAYGLFGRIDPRLAGRYAVGSHSPALPRLERRPLRAGPRDGGVGGDGLRRRVVRHNDMARRLEELCARRHRWTCAVARSCRSVHSGSSGTGWTRPASTR